MKSPKRARKRRWRKLWPIWLTFAVTFGVGIVGVLVVPKRERPVVLSPGQDLSLHLSQIDAAGQKVFAYPLSPDNRVDFFVERALDSKITVAFASCRRCLRAGYYSQDGRMLCGRCGQLMERLQAGKIPSPEKDCTHIPILWEQSGHEITIRGSAIRQAFARWYAPVPNANVHDARIRNSRRR